jgi:hypothetical protein
LESKIEYSPYDRERIYEFEWSDGLIFTREQGGYAAHSSQGSGYPHLVDAPSSQAEPQPHQATKLVSLLPTPLVNFLISPQVTNPFHQELLKPNGYTPQFLFECAQPQVSVDVSIGHTSDSAVDTLFMVDQ